MSNKIFSLIPKIMGEIGAIGKNGQNTFDNYKFRSIDDVYNRVQPVLARNGVFFFPEVLESHESTVMSKNGAAQTRIKQKIRYTFLADDGSSFQTVVEGEAIDRGDKATNKAMTAALKYMLIQVFCIAIEGQDDADTESSDISLDMDKGKELEIIRASLKAKNKTEDSLLKYLKTEFQKKSIAIGDSLDSLTPQQIIFTKETLGLA